MKLRSLIGLVLFASFAAVSHGDDVEEFNPDNLMDAEFLNTLLKDHFKELERQLVKVSEEEEEEKSKEAVDNGNDYDGQVETKNEPVNSDNDAKIDTDGSKVKETAAGQPAESGADQPKGPAADDADQSMETAVDHQLPPKEPAADDADQSMETADEQLPPKEPAAAENPDSSAADKEEEVVIPEDEFYLVVMDHQGFQNYLNWIYRNYLAYGYHQLGNGGRKEDSSQMNLAIWPSGQPRDGSSNSWLDSWTSSSSSGDSSSLSEFASKAERQSARLFSSAKEGAENIVYETKENLSKFLTHAKPFDVFLVVLTGFCLALLVYNLMHLVSRAFCKEEEEEGENSVPMTSDYYRLKKVPLTTAHLPTYEECTYQEKGSGFVELEKKEGGLPPPFVQGQVHQV